MKKKLTAMLALLIFCVPLICAAADSATDKLIKIEQDTYGSEQTGAILDRINRLEKDYSGKNMKGNMNVRIDSLYEILYGNSSKPSLVAKINAIECNVYSEVSGESILNRITKMEKNISGQTSNETLVKRVNALAQASFGSQQIPLSEMRIPRDLLIKVELEKDIGSRTLQVGDLINVKVAENVLVDGKLIFAKGLRGIGKVENVRKARGWTATNGKIKIDFFMLNCIDGREIDICVGETAQNEMRRLEMIAGASLVGMNLNNDWNKIMVHGKNIEVPAGTPLYVQTEKSLRVYGLQTKFRRFNFTENNMAE